MGWESSVWLPARAALAGESLSNRHRAVAMQQGMGTEGIQGMVDSHEHLVNITSVGPLHLQQAYLGVGEVWRLPPVCLVCSLRPCTVFINNVWWIGNIVAHPAFVQSSSVCVFQMGSGGCKQWHSPAPRIPCHAVAVKFKASNWWQFSVPQGR